MASSTDMEPTVSGGGSLTHPDSMTSTGEAVRLRLKYTVKTIDTAKTAITAMAITRLPPTRILQPSTIFFNQPKMKVHHPSFYLFPPLLVIQLVI
jgi:hypothetical protein